jgi:hypothetical protein
VGDARGEGADGRELLLAHQLLLGPDQLAVFLLKHSGSFRDLVLQGPVQGIELPIGLLQGVFRLLALRYVEEGDDGAFDVPFVVADRSRRVFHRKAAAVPAAEVAIIHVKIGSGGEDGADGTAVRRGVIIGVCRRVAQNLPMITADRAPLIPSEQTLSGRIHENRPAEAVQPQDPFTGRVENHLVLPPQLCQGRDLLADFP